MKKSVAYIKKLFTTVDAASGYTKAFKPESDFETRIFRCGIVKILVNPSGFTAFLPRTPKNSLFTKFFDLKGAAFCVNFGEAKHIRLSPMCDNEPKDTENPSF